MQAAPGLSTAALEPTLKPKSSPSLLRKLKMQLGFRCVRGHAVCVYTCPGNFWRAVGCPSCGLDCM